MHFCKTWAIEDLNSQSTTNAPYCPTKLKTSCWIFSPVCFKSPYKLLTPRSKADSDHSDPQFLPKQRFPYLSIPILSTCGTLGDKPEQIWNKLLLLLRNQILSLPFLLKLFICRACTPPPITSWYLANKISFLRLFSKNHVCYNKRSERRKEKLWQAEVSCSSWSCKWVLIIWGQWKIVGFSNPVSGWSVEILTPFATE